MYEGSFAVTVRFFGVLELYAGTRQKVVKLPERSSLENLVDLLYRENPPAYKQLVGQKNRDEPFLRVMVNDSLINPSDYGYILQPNDVVTLLPGISGGK